MEKTGIDLPGEAGTIMHKQENIGLVELATMSFGQSFQITPIQLASLCLSRLAPSRTACWISPTSSSTISPPPISRSSEAPRWWFGQTDSNSHCTQGCLSRGQVSATSCWNTPALPIDSVICFLSLSILFLFLADISFIHAILKLILIRKTFIPIFESFVFPRHSSIKMESPRIDIFSIFIFQYL